MSTQLRNLGCGCRVYVNGRGAHEGRCDEGMRLEAELVEAVEDANYLDGSRPDVEPRAYAADRALTAHDSEGGANAEL